MKKFTIYNLRFAIFLAFLLLPSSILAATISISLDKDKVRMGEILTTKIFLDTEGQQINTIEGDLKYDEHFLQVEIINIGSSFVSFWVEKPAVQNEGVIHFAGIVPGGISTNKGELFSLIFRAKTVGDGAVSLENVNLFLNDGQGTKAPAKIANATIAIIQSAGHADEEIIDTDTIPPEKFNIMRAQDPSMYDNKYFIAFSTLDKQSGLHSYEVCEYWSCEVAESPFPLRYQNPLYYVVVRAYDESGNMRASFIISKYLILLFFSVILLLIFLYCRYLYRHRV